MKTDKKLFSVTLASVALILFFTLVSSAASAASPTVTETRITTNSSNSQNPVIYGNTIVWQDDRNGNWDIYIFDLSTKEQIHTTNTANQVSPDIYGSRVVWEDERNGGHDIYLQDLSTKKQTRITKSGKAYVPKIYGNKIVWMDGRNGGSLEYSQPIGNWDIYMYDLSTSKEYQITTNNSTQVDPGIYKDRIVWGENGTIYMYNDSTSTETQVTPHPWYWDDDPANSGGDANWNPEIYGDKIVCDVETPLGNYVAKMYDLSTSTGQYIGEVDQSNNPVIYGNKIVWVDSYSIPRIDFNSDIYMYDFSTSKETHITTNKSSEKSSPAIYDNKIVWQDNRNGNWDIYMATLSSKSPVAAAFSASPTSGYVPLKAAFTDRSTGSPTSWKWSFGDGTYSTAKNPVHTYTKADEYTVSLTVKNAAESSTVTKSGFIVVKVSKAPISAFSASPRSGNAPLKVQFTDKSANSPTSWKWSFGDGKYSTQKNPVHSYSKVGKYTVSLTVKNVKGSNIKTISNYITVKK
ncbi:PKD domain-containing protein [Methanosarcina sp. UBA5]|uniref:PKD domain-containing protein n=1 Tax=Methanosarcina sp. UBA5 TaxID=1915593 RepID=UPI0025CDF61C|nr:PKD domain-containing protein [Methanosarcina sp. UBA5]